MIRVRGGSRQRWSACERVPAIARALAAGLFALSIASGPGAPSAAAISYTITDLGSLGGSRTVPYAMNNSGQVVGWSNTGPGNSPEHGFLYDATGMHDLGALVGNPTAVGYGINDAGQIVGGMRAGGDPSAPIHAFLYDGTLHDLGSPIDGYYTEAFAINASGHVAVRARVPSSTTGDHAFLYDGTAMHDLGPLPPGYGEIEPTGINASDEIIGNIWPSPDDQFHAFLWRNGVIRDLGTLGAGASFANGINDAGQVVGFAGLVASGNVVVSRAFLEDDSGMHDLGVLGGNTSFGGAINNMGQIVGSSYTDFGFNSEIHVFLDAGGMMQDLNRLFLSSPPWDNVSSLQAVAINDHGLILVRGTVGPNEHAYLLTPTPAPLIRVSAGSLDFGSQPVGTTSAAQTLTLTNAGELPLSIQGISLTGQYGTGPTDSAFAIASDSGETTLAPGASRTIGITFSPSSTSTVYAALSIQHSDQRPAAPHLVTLTGAGIVPAVTLGASSISFGGQRDGTTSDAQTVTITNSGPAPLILHSAAVQGANAADFSVPDLAGTTIAPGDSRTIGVQFTPAARGSRSATLVLTDNAPGSPQQVSLTGTGIAPVARLSPGALLDFGPQPVGLNATVGLLLQNTGDAPLQVGSLTFQGPNADEFSLATGGSGQTLQPGDIALLNIRFSPSMTGSRSATLVIPDDAAGSPQSVALTGFGTAPLLRLSADSLIFGLQPGGAQTLTLTNTGDAPLNITGLDVSGPDAGHFQIVSDTGEQSLPVGGSRTVQIAFRSATVASAPHHARIAAVSYYATLEVRDNDPHPGTPHTVSLIATFGGGSSADTTPSPSGVTPASPPAAPSGLSAHAPSASEIDLAWMDNSSNEQAFAIWRTGGGQDWARVGIMGPHATSYTDTTVQPGVAYTYKVRAVNGGGASGWSNTVVLTPGAPPAAPTGLTASPAAGNGVVLTWSNNSSDEQALAIWRTGGGQDWARVGIASPQSTSYTDASATPNTAYTYQVRAINRFGASNWSNTVSITPGASAPAAPTGLAATVTSAQVTLTWSSNSSDEQAFAIWRSGGGQDWARIGIMGPGATSYTDSSVQPNTAYSYQVRAINRFGASGWSNTVSVTTGAAPPAAPAGLAATVSGGQVTLTWTNPSPDAHAFAIWRQGGGRDWARVGIAGPQATTYTDSGLTPGNSYTYRVRAIGAGGASGWSNEVSVQMPAAP